MKETLEHIKARHKQEIEMLCKNCEHQNIIVLQGVDGMKAPIGSYDAPIGGRCYYEFEIRCRDCGKPLVSWENGKISLFVKANYYAPGATGM